MYPDPAASVRGECECECECLSLRLSMAAAEALLMGFATGGEASSAIAV